MHEGDEANPMPTEMLNIGKTNKGVVTSALAALSTNREAVQNKGGVAEHWVMALRWLEVEDQPFEDCLALAISEFGQDGYNRHLFSFAGTRTYIKGIVDYEYYHPIYNFRAVHVNQNWNPCAGVSG